MREETRAGLALWDVAAGLDALNVIPAGAVALLPRAGADLSTPAVIAQAQVAGVDKAHVLAIPTNAVPELMLARTPQAMMAILTRWCRGAFQAIADTLSKSCRRCR